MNHLLYYGKENQAPPTSFSLKFFIFLSLQLKKTFICLFSGMRGLQSTVDVSCLPESGFWCLCIPLFLQFSFKFQNIKFLLHFSVRPAKLKLDTHMGNGLIYCAHQIHAARIYLFLYFSSFFVSPISKDKKLDLEHRFNIPLMAMAVGM